MPNRSSDFRFIFANVLGFQFSDNDCRILFAIDEGGGVENALEQIGVAMTHKTAKLLGQTLSSIVADFEVKSGNVITLDPAKIQELSKVLEKVNPTLPIASPLPPSQSHSDVPES